MRATLDNDPVDPTLDSVRDHALRLAPPPARIAVAVSGGGDSVALALALAGESSLVALLHVDHGLRDASETEADRALVAALAERVGVPLLTRRIDVAAAQRARGGNLAEVARRLRYGALSALAKEAGADAIALGHTQDDQAETVVMQLLRGAATLHGMPERRGRLLRPCLGVSREALHDALRAADQPWRDDPANDDLRRRRAHVRQVVLPVLEETAPGVRARLARLATVQADLRAFSAEEAARRLRGLPGEVDAETLRAQPPAIQRAALAAMLTAAGVAVDEARVEGVRERLTGGGGAWRLQVGPETFARVADGRLAVASDAPVAAPVRVERPDQLPAEVSPDVLGGAPLELRGRRPGDVIRLPGGSRRVSDLMIDARVPRERRHALRVLARGREVLWVEGLATAVGAGPTPGRHVDPDEAWMRRALALADRAAADGELPVGALVLVDGVVVGEGWNRSVAVGDATAHAEMVALRAAAASLGRRQLHDTTLVVTLEPCPMCFGAALQTHVGRIVFGARNRRDGALGGVSDLWVQGWKRRPEVRGGVLAKACGERLTRFFAGRRGGDAG